ncbi:FAD/NAD(P)-binding protein [Phytohabitans kaempferiae]|uniref:FAD/NAD(P)-binding protein n=1 Tax=Phytohabitans kaempferiae TaxID=1620943 RepID=A0ABV6MA16_9ACTN
MTTVIVGGGPAGTLTALALLRHTDQRVVLVDPAERLGPGTAFATREPHHLLNSRAGAMSAAPDAPADFVDWCHRSGYRVSANAFQARGWFGDYLADRLAGAFQRHGDRLLHRRAHVLRIVPGGQWRLQLTAGPEQRADHVVLAIGHAPPRFPLVAQAPVREAPGYVATPWEAHALDGIAAGDRVLLLGTGLTAVDVVLSLIARGHRGQITAVSRHGLLPLPHLGSPAGPLPPPLPGAPTVRELLRQFRTVAVDDWRSLVDRVRLQAEPLWRGLPLDERRRFLRHALRLWEVHRHRCAPWAANAIDRTRDAGLLMVHKGGPTAIRTVGRAFDVDLGGEPQGFDVVVNCTGPGHPAGIPLVRTLVADGLARADPLGLGVDVDLDGRLVPYDGGTSPAPYVVGALRLGQWLETTAIPEIRQQAHHVARAIGSNGAMPTAA